MKHNKKAFTLIELLVVIAIIGILATISVIALSNARAKARDAKRIADTKQVSTALELFFNDNNRYPTDAEFNSGTLSSSTVIYMQNIPTAPTPNDGTCDTNQNAFTYHQTEDGGSYTISMCLGNNTGSLDAGPKCLTPAGVIDVDCSTVTPSFTCETDSVTYGGYNYSTVLIGSQCWFKDNLRTALYNDDTVIPTVTDNAAWGSLATDAHCWYKNDSSTYNDYGQLYNFYAVNTGKLCPVGWHIPSDAEWATLTNGLSDAVTLMESGTTHWDHATGNNSSGFTALPGGDRDGSGTFDYITSTGCMWSSDFSGSDAHDFCIYSNGSFSNESGGFKLGDSVRCLKD